MNRFISAMPSSMCWPLRRKIPGVGRGNALALEGVRHLLAREQAAPVHPGAEIGRDGHVGRCRDDAVGELGLAAGELVEDQPEALPASTSTACLATAIAPARRWAAPRAGACSWRGTAPRRGTSASVRGRDRSAPRTCPIRGPAASSLTSREAFHLRRRHQAGVVVLVAGERQAEALDRVGDETDRAVVLDASEGIEQRSAGRGRRDWSSAAPAPRRSACRSAA